MGLRQCEKCSEMVDEAKAFCPGCGHAFVEEQKRQKASEFEKQDNTVQLGQTMYNQMLSDLGLNLSKSGVPEKRIEVIAPVATEPTARSVQPAVAPVQEASPTASSASPNEVKKPGLAKWIVIGIVGFILLFPPALASTIALVLQLLSRYR